ncbi:hypothetical protein U1Q18_012572 [Sarracenia purpurea var. burkii]
MEVVRWIEGDDGDRVWGGATEVVGMGEGERRWGVQTRSWDEGLGFRLDLGKDGLHRVVELHRAGRHNVGA